ncbi:MAG: hypothetical protein ACTSVR_08385 [Candidatus Thorarchaeota archaeon]
MSNIAGPYVATYSGGILGITNQGVTMSHQVFKEKITGDVLGDATIDNVYLGTDVFVETILNEYNAAGAQGAFWPYHATLGAIGIVGKLDSAYAQALILTVVAGTSAATAGPTTVTFTKAILADNFPVNILFSSRHRKVPLRFQVLPQGVDQQMTGDEALFTTT